ncbi:MAG: diguanylate cyclase [Chloroflexota bacterium]
MSDAARRLGVHPNTVRSWTDRGVLRCMRINERGDRRYAPQDIDRFLTSRDDQPDGRPPTERSRIRAILARSAELAARADDPGIALDAIARLLCHDGGYRAAVFLGSDGSQRPVRGTMRPNKRLGRLATSGRVPVIGRPRGDSGKYQAALPVSTVDACAGALMLEGSPQSRTIDEIALLAGVAAQLEVSAALSSQLGEMRRREQRAEMLLSIGSDMSSRLDPDLVLTQLVDRAVQAFGAQRAGVFLNMPDGSFQASVTRNLSVEFCQVLDHASNRPLTALALTERRVVTATDYGDDPRSFELRTAIRREGFNTVAVAPLISEGDAFGVLSLYHDEHHDWPEADLALLGRLARHGAAVMRSAQDYSQMATWTAQLQSIQQLGAQLTRLRSVAEIGNAICAELVQLIDTHNTRVYRVVGEICEPVSWRGQIGEYESEDGEQLRLHVGEGVTGWVARFGLAQNVGDAAHDKRAQTIPGTEDDLDESLLLAPMLYEDNVIGVIVLAKLGLNQFTADDLRLLEIYATIAAQAMANADVTERLHAQSEALARQVSSQRELLRVTESILGTLDTQTLLEEIAERLKTLVQVDNIYVDLHDQHARVLRPVFAHGLHSAGYLAAVMPEDQGVGGYVLRTGEAQLVQDQLADERVFHFAESGPEAGAMIVAPLRDADRIRGTLTIERLGAEAAFTEEEFELVKLFAAHVAIALRNAAQHRAVELRAETDRLTGLWNHGSLTEQLERLINSRARFSMLMVDLDHFKEYNDANGHQAGNAMLQRVAQQLRASCRDTDLVYRFGGDEFVVILPATNLVGARTVAAKIKDAIAGLDSGERTVGLTCSVGVAAHPRDGRDSTQMILAADRACYAAKRSGRNRIATATEGLALAGEFQPTEPQTLETAENEPAYTAA